MDRVDMDFKNIDSTVIDISTEFKHLTLSDIRLALKKGALGNYGRSFKLSTQEVCFWIKEYVKEKNKDPRNKNKVIS